MIADSHTTKMSKETDDSFHLSPELNPFISELSAAKYDTSKMIPIVAEMAKSNQLVANEFPPVPNAYSRTILHREPNGFEIMMARWSKTALTPIHGHPRFTFVFLIEGEVTETSFVQEKETLAQTDSKRYTAGDFSFDIGIEGKFDNFIHQMYADHDSLSLHIYSDDALKGEIFTL